MVFSSFKFICVFLFMTACTCEGYQISEKGRKYAILQQRKSAEKLLNTPVPTTTTTTSSPPTTEDPFFSSDNDIFADFDEAFEGMQLKSFLILLSIIIDCY